MCASDRLRDFAADDLAFGVDREDERAAELFEAGVKLRVLRLRVILLGEDNDDGLLVGERLALACGDVRELSIFPVAHEGAGHAGFGAKLWDERAEEADCGEENGVELEFHSGEGLRLHPARSTGGGMQNTGSGNASAITNTLPLRALSV